MATAAKPARDDQIIIVEDGVPYSFSRVISQVPIQEETLSAAEEYAQLTGEEIFAASKEQSNQYNGRVLARAIVIVQTRIRCLNLPAFAKKVGLGRVTMYRHATGRPCSDLVFRRVMRDLAILPDEEGGRLQ